MKSKLFYCLLISFCYTTMVANGQKPVYPIPAEDLAKYNKKAAMPPRNYLQTTFDSILKQFKLNPAPFGYELPSGNAFMTKGQAPGAKSPQNTPTCFRLTKDINATTGSSSPANSQLFKSISFAVMNNVSYFSADDGIHGQELWRSNGTAAGTYLVKDINPGPASSFPSGITEANGLLFFYAQTIDTGFEPWVSGGTESNTHLLIDLYSGPNSSFPDQFVQVGGAVFFVASLFDNNHQLWKTDGTEAGTSLVKDLSQAGVGNHILEMTAVNDKVYFIASTWVSGWQLFRSDGTDAGTYMIKQIGTYQSDRAAPMQLTAYNNKLYFSVNDGINGRRLWVSDGTEAGTNYAPDPIAVFLHEELLSTNSNEPFSILNNVLYISGFTQAEGSGLYKFDASNSQGVVLVKDLTPAAETIEIAATDMMVVNDRIYFSVINSINGFHVELWTSNGEAANTSPAKVFVSGESISGFYNSNGAFFFTKFEYLNEQELWKSDGTDAGTVIVKDIIPGSAGSWPRNPTFCNGKLLFSAEDYIHGRELWSTDGTGPGTLLVKDINSSTTETSLAGSNSIAGGFYKGIASSGNGVVFGAFTHEKGMELYKSDGTKPGTKLLHDIAEGIYGSTPRGLIFRNGFNYFIGDNLVGTTIYRTDGKPEGLKKLVPDINWDMYFINSFEVTDNGRPFYILGNRNLNDYELWTSDGTQAGTLKLASNLPYESYVVTSDNRVYFAAMDETHGIELWKSDGTTQGTKIVTDIYPGFNSSGPYSLFVYKKEVYFGAYDGVGGNNYQLWKSNGSEKGTVKLKNITPARYDYASNPDAQVFCISGHTLFISATDFQSYGAELWKTNGRSAGTYLVKDINPQGDSNPNYLTDVDGLLYFTADDGVHLAELWSSRGTWKTTKLVKDITPDEGSSLNSFCGVGNKLYFINGFDNRLWSSYGAANNTTAVTDPGLEGITQFGRLVSAGNKLFLGGRSHQYGAELYVGDACTSNGSTHHPFGGESKGITPNADFDALIYPNPSDGPVTLRLSGAVKNVTVTITDVSGKVIWQRFLATSLHIKLPVEKLTKGIYIITVNSSLGFKTLKLVKP